VACHHYISKNIKSTIELIKYFFMFSVLIKETKEQLMTICLLFILFNNISITYQFKEIFEEGLKFLFLAFTAFYINLSTPHPSLNLPLRKIVSRQRTIDSFEDSEIPIYFRFRSKEQLHKLIKCFQFPEFFTPDDGHVFHREEVLLFGIYRLSHLSSLYDPAYVELFGHDGIRVSKIFKLFINFMVDNWGYILLDNGIFWKPYLNVMAEAIRQKCISLGCDFKEVSDPNGGFNIFGFKDNTLNATCRPGGGPQFVSNDNGQYAPRNDNEIQEAFYNGWKVNLVITIVLNMCMNKKLSYSYL
jgi:hypothetical protein